MNLTSTERFCKSIIIRQLLASLGRRSSEEAAHAARVAVYSVAIGDTLLLSEDELLNVRYGASLHDIGKLTWPLEMFERRMAVTHMEKALIRRHPLEGVQRLASLTWLKPARAAILYHHERWDGSGYPIGLKREAIPLSARIVAVAEVFDCLTMPSGWRDPISERAALGEIESLVGVWFDPIVAKAFFEIQPLVQPVGM